MVFGENFEASSLLQNVFFSILLDFKLSFLNEIIKIYLIQIFRSWYMPWLSLMDRICLTIACSSFYIPPDTNNNIPSIQRTSLYWWKLKVKEGIACSYRNRGRRLYSPVQSLLHSWIYLCESPDCTFYSQPILVSNSVLCSSHFNKLFHLKGSEIKMS